MNWPPPKSFTSTKIRLGFRHFVAINYGGSGLERWVNLVSVLDGHKSLVVSWSELTDTSLWIRGWIHLPRDEGNPSKDIADEINYEESILESRASLYPSEDSGLIIPTEIKNIRSW